MKKSPLRFLRPSRLWATIQSRTGISIAKGVLAYVLAFILIFLGGFDRLQTYPITYTNTVLVAIAGGAGKSVGACLDTVVLAMLGVGTGAVGFVILAKLAHAPVAQGFVFFLLVYVYALIKARGLRWFAFSLLGIVMSFQGVYTSLLLEPTGVTFSPVYLEDYLKSYLWGAAIVVFVNVCIFPISSEKELRGVLVTSMHHISTLLHLIAKTYTLDLSDEDRATRDSLNASIRQDFALLNQKLDETGLEINWSRWSMHDYRNFADRTKSAIQDLISMYSTLETIGKDNEDMALFREKFLPTTGRPFARMRRACDLTIDDVVEKFALKPAALPSQGHDDWRGYFRDQPSSDDDVTLPGDHQDDHDDDADNDDVETGQRLLKVSDRLRAEVANTSPDATPRHSTDNLRGLDNGDERTTTRLAVPVTEGDIEGGTPTAIGTPNVPLSRPLTRVPPTQAVIDGEKLGAPDCQRQNNRAGFLRATFDHFHDSQLAIIAEVISSGALVDADAPLQVMQPLPSIHEDYSGTKPLSRSKMSKASAFEERPTLPPTIQIDHVDTKTEPATDGADDQTKDNTDLSSHGATSLLRVYGFLYGTDKLITHLTELHDLVMAPSKSRLHFHFLEQIPKPPNAKKRPGQEPPMPVDQAIAMLEGRTWVKPKITLGYRLEALERQFRSDVSLSSFKTACAVITLATIILAPSSRTFFTSYGLTSGLISIVVAMAPTLGQSFLTFLLQIGGTGFGSIYGCIVLEIFKNVGHTHFNAPGIVCLLALFAIPCVTIIYTRPQMFALGFLAMNGAGTIIVTEWTYRKQTFDSPGLRLGKAVSAMCIALGTAACFQLLILRTPARQTLRRGLGSLVAMLSAQHVLYQKYIEAVSINRDVPEATLIEVNKTLSKRAMMIQGHLISLMPLIKFSGAEPSFTHPFVAKPYIQIIRSCQVILDRMRESRSALGTEQTPDIIRDNISIYMRPYRKQAIRYQTTLFYLAATSLLTKRPLPSDFPSPARVAKFVHHDAMVLAARMARTPEGLKFVSSRQFGRFLAYLLTITSLAVPLETIERTLQTLFGNVQNDFWI